MPDLKTANFSEDDAPPDWETIELPEAAVLAHLTDVHCHPTDVSFTEDTVQSVRLGGLTSMATRTTDQNLVSQFGEDHGRTDEDEFGEERRSKRRRRDGPEVIACFGYHPWFCHLLHLQDPQSPPSKQEHYQSIFLPNSSAKDYDSQSQLLEDILPDLPEPLAFRPLLEEMRRNAVAAQKRGSLVMIGEVGLDKSFRVPYPGKRKQWDDQEERSRNEAGTNHVPPQSARSVKVQTVEATIATSGAEELAAKPKEATPDPRTKNLTPFRPSIEHQTALLELQLDLAVELGINVSLHSVKAQGPTLDFLQKCKKKHGKMFTERVNVDIHSCGGWSIENWIAASRTLPNLYISPSLAVSGRSPITPDLIRAVDPDRLLVESDTHLIANTTRRTWAAAVWIAKCRGWKVEWKEEELDVDEEEMGVVRRLERNWERFMNL